MAKGQKRSNRELKKPKKAKVVVVAPTFLPKRPAAAIEDTRKKP